jgi:hypothetical protein
MRTPKFLAILNKKRINVNDEIIFNKIAELIKICNDIKEVNETLGNIFLMNVENSMQIIQSLNSEKELDISEKISLISELVGIKLEDIVIEIMNNNRIDTENSEQESVDFIINNSDIDDYEKFLKKNLIKESIEELKGEL